MDQMVIPDEDMPVAFYVFAPEESSGIVLKWRCSEDHPGGAIGSDGSLGRTLRTGRPLRGEPQARSLQHV
jgi:hypothetical protein